MQLAAMELCTSTEYEGKNISATATSDQVSSSNTFRNQSQLVFVHPFPKSKIPNVGNKLLLFNQPKHHRPL